MERILKLTGMMSVFLLLFLTACEEEEETEKETMDDVSITVEDQIISQNTIDVKSATININSGWLVVHKSENGNPMLPEIITEPVHIDQGNTKDIRLQLKSSASISDGEILWVMLHEDTGNENEYEYGSDENLDPPVTKDGSPIAKQIKITAPKVQASDQSISNNNALIDKVVAGVGGWVVIHKDDGTGTPGAVIGHEAISAGTSGNVSVSLTDTMNYTEGIQLFPMLHIDNGTEGVYEFPNSDPPEIFGNASSNIILTSFMIEAEGNTSDTIMINIENTAFNPSDKTISVGTTVKWVNNDSFAHTVTSEDGLFDSGNISGGETYTRTFNSSGSFPYVCTIHSGMNGTITVE